MTMKCDPNSPAFPVPRVDIDCLPPACLGLTKREFAVIEAMKGLAANPTMINPVKPKNYKIALDECVVTCAVQLADALFAALNREAE
jgi:hypothetical protein